MPRTPGDAEGAVERIARFAATLRDHGFAVGIGEQQAMVRAALALPVERSARLDAAWRAIACHDRHDWRRWPELFERHWHPQRTRGRTTLSSGRSATHPAPVFRAAK